MCLSAMTARAGDCGEVTKKTYSDENCNNLVKTETLPASDSARCNEETDGDSGSHKLSCNGGFMQMLQYKQAGCTGKYLSMAKSPNNRCVKDDDTKTHVMLTFSS